MHGSLNGCRAAFVGFDLEQQPTRGNLSGLEFGHFYVR